ncbi:S10 family peptidase [Candidatus Palauibacter sp.]|uniref:S10 family peptidase n=1 Tax=Candidatus Palauibacter sp. TaxID=3101350 RepID=UPI003D1084C8
MKPLSLITPVLALGLLPAGALAQDEPGAGGNASEPQPARWASNHSIVVDGATVEYEAVVGSVILRDNEENATGELFYTGYFRTNGGDPSTRPIVFAYNGGPGSASFWLHMGIMGPRRVVTPNVGQQAPPPYPLVDNGYTVLDIADVVMVDPIGTGFSRPAGDADGTHFWGMDEDAASLTQFIRRFLSEKNRWNSPRYILGESYGTTRSVLLARHLQNANIDLNGVVLVSAVIDFNTLQFPDGSHIGFITNVPSFAVAAEYHDMLPGGRPDDLETFMKEVEAWALTDYAQALLAGTAVDPELRARVLRQMHEYTGLSMEYLDKADLRVSAPAFEKELLRDRRLTLARLDTRFTGPTGDLLDLTPDHDAQSSAISSAYTSLFNTYVRDELGYDGDREYWPSGMARPWNWEREGGRRGPFGGSALNVGPDLAHALERNPRLEVLLINGIYDFATPYFPIVWSLEQLGLPPDLRDNITRDDFAAGHMMYVEESLLPQWRETLAGFITRTAGGNLVP